MGNALLCLAASTKLPTLFVEDDVVTSSVIQIYSIQLITYLSSFPM